jgi:hypothetical protein
LALVSAGLVETARLSPIRRFSRAEVVVDLGRQQPRLVDRERHGGGLVALPLLPNAEPDQSGERDDGG